MILIRRKGDSIEIGTLESWHIVNGEYGLLMRIPVLSTQLFHAVKANDPGDTPESPGSHSIVHLITRHFRPNDGQFMKHVSAKRLNGFSWGSIGVFFLLCAVIIFRKPALFVTPRFWAEEGKVYFAYAFHHSWMDTLFFVVLGYYSLFTNVIAIIASHCVALEYSPFVTTYAAFIVQIIPIGVILWGKSLGWKVSAQKLLLCLVYVFIPHTQEVWLNTINSQFFFLLTVFLILMEDDSDISRFRKIVYRILMVVACLTGTTSFFLFPMFIFKYMRYRTQETLRQIGIMVGTGLVHAAVILHLLASGHVYSDRMIGLNAYTFFASLMVRLIVEPILGMKATRYLEEVYLVIEDCGRTGVVLSTTLISALLFVILVWIIFQNQRNQKESGLMLGSFILVTTGMFICCINDKTDLIVTPNGQRYFMVPMFILASIMLLNIRLDRSISTILFNGLTGLMLMACLIHGTYRFYTHPPALAQQAWRDEISEWRRHSNHPIAIAPRTWTMTLKRDKIDSVLERPPF